MKTNDNKDLDDKKWNNTQRGNSEQELNEGFSGGNIPNDYNPSDETIENRLKNESETDQSGNNTEVMRARYPGNESSASANENADNSVIENRQSLQNRDHNYDKDAHRNLPSHRENAENRGNIKLDDDKQ
ncbi:MAG TPA: hypothetical protein VK623_12745 [Flavobacterium sp.]|nr:hypothetical protein [Flavobacterium sp.]